MANHLSMATIDAILTLHNSGHSNRQIAHLLGVHRETVGKHIAQQSSENRPNAPPGSRDSEPPGESGPSDPHGSTAGKRFTGQPGPQSACEPYREVILAKLAKGLSSKRIHQDLIDEHDITMKYWSVRRFVSKLQKNCPLPFRRMETARGEEAQIDFGTGAPIVGFDGRRRRPWVLRVVLSYSRKGYSEAVYHQSSEAFIGCIENAFHHFGGSVKKLVIDNLKAAVAKADWYDPEIHPKLQSFAAHYGTVFMPTKPYTPRHKGKVESGVNYVKENGLKGHTFRSLAEQNDHLLNWETNWADTRIHGTTKKQVGPLFEEDERTALIPLPIERFPFFHEGRRVVHRDGHVEVDKSYYSVPPEYVGRRLWARWDSRMVRLFDHRWQQVAIHAKADPGRFSTASAHIPDKKVSSVERGAAALLSHVSMIGPQTRDWASAMTQARGVEGIRTLVGLKELAGKYPSEALEKACEMALSHGAYRLRTLRTLLKRQEGQRQEQFEFLEEHPIIRPLSDYSLESLHEFRKDRHELKII